MAQGQDVSELVQMVHGYKLFISVITGAFSVIISLLLVIWSNMLKSNNKRHKDNEEQLKVAMNNQTALTILVNRHDVEIEHLKDK